MLKLISHYFVIQKITRDEVCLAFFIFLADFSHVNGPKSAQTHMHIVFVCIHNHMGPRKVSECLEKTLKLDSSLTNLHNFLFYLEVMF